jgi:cyclopropane fatty-acyl-phospholipid synthase-like methyltransferase
MSGSDIYWSNFWADKADPLHSGNDDAYYDRLASELKIILPQKFSSVLEVGCGNGCFYERLGFDKTAYHGIDYSPAMIASFTANFPSASVAVKDFREYAGTLGLDLIFSHGVVQYITINEFDEQIARSRSLLQVGGYIVHAGVLRKSSRRAMMTGELWDNPGNPVKNGLRYLTELFGLRRTMGHWYSLPDVRKIARKHGFTAQFYGSLLYPYRFHVVMQKLG